MTLAAVDSGVRIAAIIGISIIGIALGFAAAFMVRETFRRKGGKQ